MRHQRSHFFGHAEDEFGETDPPGRQEVKENAPFFLDNIKENSLQRWRTEKNKDENCSDEKFEEAVEMKFALMN